MQPAKLPLDRKKTNEAYSDACLVRGMMNTCLKRIESGHTEETEPLVRSLFDYCSLLKNPFLIYPKLRKEYRSFVLDVINLYPSLKEIGLNSIYRIMDFRDDYYYIK